MAKNLTLTKLHSINVKCFRGLRDVNIDFGKRITVICGKNGTSKSTILGIVAQIFNFTKDYSKKPEESLGSFRTLTNKRFKSPFSEHFRFSSTYDLPGTMDVKIKLFDGAFNKELENLRLGLVNSESHNKPRPVVRGNDADPEINHSRNVTHPVIYLSLQRLLPITLRAEYSARDIEYVIDNKDEIMAMNRRLLIKNSGANVTTTTGTIDSLVVHGDNYDHESVSVGEDNVGQIIQSIFSFKRLMEQYENYHGGILLIDEADAGLFPAAQVELIKILTKVARNYGLQIIMTSHSPVLIEEVYKLSQTAPADYSTVYLTDTYGPIQAKNNLSWPEINADLLVETIKVKDDISLPKVNVYFEDREAYDFLKQLVTERNINKILNPLKDINISCSTLFDLMARKIPEFVTKSIVVLDGDVIADRSPNAKKAQQEKNLCILPTDLPPDQLIFEFLYNLEPSDEFWKGNNGFTKVLFRRISADIIDKLKLGDAPISLNDYIADFKKGKNEDSIKGVIRTLFKEFAHNSLFLSLVNGPVAKNPYRYWIKHHPEEAAQFKDNFRKNLLHVLINGYGVESAIAVGYLSSNK
ncbi:AAA family ATPase [Cronobacter turicensis]|nr:AAA family ATPase [Cronobacter turicensis]